MGNTVQNPLSSSQGAEALPSSFRDPSGFLFTRDGKLYRQVNSSYGTNYDLLLGSGLYDELVLAGKLVRHTEVDTALSPTGNAYKVIQPELVPFISYPHEWSFSQLKDAALLTIDIAERAFSRGIMLKDASAYNVQFFDGHPIFIDTLSFEKYTEGSPWVAYKQFCQHFLAPLALMSYCDISLGKLPEIFIDGVPLPLASKLLPWKTKFKMNLYLHIHLHAKSQIKYSNSSSEAAPPKIVKISKNGILGLFDGLRSAVSGLVWKPEGTEWGDYYEATNYSPESMDAKQKIVDEFVRTIKPASVWDLGANTGVFSRIAAASGAHVVSFDIDPAAVEKNYRAVKEKQTHGILPLILDLTNPTSSFGWASSERMSFAERGPADLTLALALIHHLAISNNVPLENVAKFFSSVCRHLVIEFVPKSDSQVKRLLRSREDIFPNYTKEGFEAAFSNYFTIEKAKHVEGSERTVYLMKVSGN